MGGVRGGGFPSPPPNLPHQGGGTNCLKFLSVKLVCTPLPELFLHDLRLEQETTLDNHFIISI